MVRIFFDTEFTEFSYKPGAALISIGLVSEQGECFYAELSDTYYSQHTNYIVQTEVLPHLTGGEARMRLSDARQRLAQWVAAFGEKVIFVCDGKCWDDADWLEYLLQDTATAKVGDHIGTLRNALSSLPDQAHRLANLAEETYFKHNPRHHALHDAKALQSAWRAVEAQFGVLLQ